MALTRNAVFRCSNVATTKNFDGDTNFLQKKLQVPSDEFTRTRFFESFLRKNFAKIFLLKSCKSIYTYRFFTILKQYCKSTLSTLLSAV